MSKSVVVRYETTAETAEENQRLVEQVYADLNAAQPDGLRYATFRLSDGRTFVHVAVVDGPKNPLEDLPAFSEFQRNIGTRVVGPPVAADATVVGSYRLFD